jgi:hypothetical protein
MREYYVAEGMASRWTRRVTLALVALLASLTRCFSAARFEAVIHEYDPYFNLRVATHMAEKGLAHWWNGEGWWDADTWYVYISIHPSIYIYHVTVDPFRGGQDKVMGGLPSLHLLFPPPTSSAICTLKGAFLL